MQHHYCQTCGQLLTKRINKQGNLVLNKRFCSNECYHETMAKGKNACRVGRLMHTKGQPSKSQFETAIDNALLRQLSDKEKYKISWNGWVSKPTQQNGKQLIREYKQFRRSLKCAPEPNHLTQNK